MAWTLKDVSSLLAVPRTRIQFYIKEGLLEKEHTGKGVPFEFDERELTRLFIIRELSRNGFNLSMIKRLVKTPAVNEEAGTVTSVCALIDRFYYALTTWMKDHPEKGDVLFSSCLIVSGLGGDVKDGMLVSMVIEARHKDDDNKLTIDLGEHLKHGKHGISSCVVIDCSDVVNFLAGRRKDLRRG